MELSEYIQEVSELPIPTEDQKKSFVQHVMGAHSWYKHLDLLDGANFFFFLAKDVGGGYTEDNPRLHYSWKTRDEYITRFGYLDYQYQTHRDGPYYRDYGGIVYQIEGKYSLEKFTREYVSLPKEIVYLSNVKLFPYMSNQGNAVEAVKWSKHKSCVNQIVGGASHQDRDLILEWNKKAIDCVFVPDSDDELKMLQECSYNSKIWKKLDSYKRWERKEKELWKTYSILMDSQESEIIEALNKFISWLTSIDKT